MPKQSAMPANLRHTTLVESIRVLQTPSFRKTVKKLNANQKIDLDTAVRKLMDNPLIGEQKKGDLAFLRVLKFTMEKQPTLLGYSFDQGALVLALLALGSHENFYRDIKR